MEQGYSFNQIAILYRTHYIAHTLKEHFLKNSIPFYKVYDDSIYNGLSVETHSPGEDNSFLDRTEYQCPIYFFLAENDLSCNPKMAELYFESINAPDKGLGYTTGGHECTMYHSEDLVNFIHQAVLDNNQ